MSLSASTPSAARPLEDQARALEAFLANRGNALTPSQSRDALDGLPDDPKPAAKELRGRLQKLGVDIQHTHALKAVAEARGSGSFLGLGEQLRYDLASWAPDTAGISCERVQLSSFAAAADEMCRRLREQFEGDAPYVALHPYRDRLMVAATSTLTGSWWHMLLAPASGPGAQAVFPDVAMLERHAERLRRLVEGQLGGWLDGTYDVGQALGDQDETTRGMSLRHECDFPEQLQVFYRGTKHDELPEKVPDAEHWLFWKPLTQSQWDDFRKRYAFFARRNATALFEWSQELRLDATKPRFEPVAVNRDALESARLAAKLSWNDVWALFLYDDEGAGVRDLKAGKAALDVLQLVAKHLDVHPNELLAQQRSTPRMPLPHHTDIGMWLSRLDAVVSLPEGSPAVPPGLAERLQSLCKVPYVQRRSWAKRPPAELEALNQEIRFAGLLVCAGMGTRFVEDLPLGWTRPASVSILEFDRQIDVLTQGGQLDEDNRMMNIAPERDAATPEWLSRFNKPRFTANDLLRYSDMVHEIIKGEQDEKERFTSKVLAGVKVFSRDAEKAHAASVRMEALSALIEDRPMEPWVRTSKNSEEGALMLSEAAFEATARCQLTNVNGEPGFDRHAFYMMCVEHSRKYS